MKRSRSGTRSPATKRSARQTLGPLLAVVAVLAFVASFVFGLGRGADRRSAVADEEAQDSLVVPDSRVRVQVLNGSEKSGLAALATDQLREAGYDVVSIGNARSSVAKSIVLDRVGNRALADSIARVLGITRVETRRDTSLYLEVTVILGPEWGARRMPLER
jgi:LytR cell envelope-related transcriptional attenuator